MNGPSTKNRSYPLLDSLAVTSPNLFTSTLYIRATLQCSREGLERFVPLGLFCHVFRFSFVPWLLVHVTLPMSLAIDSCMHAVVVALLVARTIMLEACTCTDPCDVRLHVGRARIHGVVLRLHVSPVHVRVGLPRTSTRAHVDVCRVQLHPFSHACTFATSFGLQLCVVWV